MNRKRRGQQGKRKKRASHNRTKSVQCEIKAHTIPSAESHPVHNTHLFEQQAEQSPHRINLLRTRRAFLGAMSAVAVAVMGGAIGNVASSTWERSRENDRKVERFFFLFETEQYPLAFNVGLDLLSGLSRDSQEFILWLNNLACAVVWGGKFQDAYELLKYAQLHARSWETAIIDSNLAYVQYHLGNSTRGLIPHIERAAKLFPRQEFGADRWLQLWSRQETTSSTLVPPLGVLMRLYAKEGRFQDAFASGEADIKLQGYRAQGTRICLGFIARPAQAERVALGYTDDVKEEHNPASSWEHMKSASDLVLSNLTRKSLSGSSTFRGQAASVKGAYYSWANLADLKHFLAPGVSPTLRYEYGRLIVSSYQEAGQADLDAIMQIEDLLR